MLNKKQFVIRTALSIGVSFLILGLMLRFALGEGDAARPQLLMILRKSWRPLIALYLVFSLLQAVVRAIRYRLLIRAAGERNVPSLFHTLLVTLARNMFVDLLPARVGELSYVALMNKGYNVAGNACVSSLGISFLFDLVALLFLMGVLAIGQLATAQLHAWLVVVMLILLAAVAVLLVLVFAGIRRVAAVLRRLSLPNRAQRLLDRIQVFLEHLAEAVDFTRRSGTLLHVLGLSLLVRVTKYVGLGCLFYAVAKPSFAGLADAPFLGVLTALISAEAGASLPVPAFMSFGTYEAGGLLALTMLGFSAAASSVAMLAMHILSQCIDYALGGLGLVLVFGLAGAPSRQRPPHAKSHRGILAATAALLLILGIGFLGYQARRVKKLGALAPPEQGSGGTPTAAEHARRSAVTSGIDGFLVWSSNRFGNHDILMLSLPDLSIVALTSHPHVDTFPRISPDGTRIAFCRSQQPWVSQRNEIPWDVYVLDLATNRERLIARQANVPTWSESGDAVHFQRNSSTLVEHNLASGTERVLFRAGEGAVPGGVALQTPSYSARREAMAVTLRGRHRKAVVYSAADRPPVTISRTGCQLAWAPDASFLYLVDHGGKMKTAFHRYAPDGTDGHLWLDLPGNYSHEYFPRLSNDQAYLVFGASTGGHEHDTADYEIFIWPVEAAPADAARLTFHTGNDCWPDLFVRP